MTLASSIVLVLGLAIAAYVIYCVLVLRQLSTPTKGASIDLAVRPNRALIVIDVQEDFTRRAGPNGFPADLRDRAIEQVCKDIQTARTAGNEVIFVQNIFRNWVVKFAMMLGNNGAGNEGREGLRIDRDLDVGNAPVFEKNIGDSFSSREFEAYLAEKKVGHLTLVGLDACHCVQLTAKGALARGYQVEIRETGTLTAFPHKWPEHKDELTGLGARITAA